MKRFALFLSMVLMCGVLSAQPAPGQRPGGPGGAGNPGGPGPEHDPIADQLFPPELIMGHQEELQLKDTQRATVRAEIVKLQSKVVDLQFQLSDEVEKLGALLRAAPVDEAKALEQADKVMSLEHDIKRLHLGALIRIKNALTPEQIAKLRDMRRRPQ